MNETTQELWRLAQHAEQAAAEAAAHIESRRPQHVEHKEGGGDYLASQVVTEIDRQAEAIIMQRLQPVLGDFGLLTEETPDDGSRLEAEAFWCVDPLDGTLAYIHGEPGPAVSIALVRRDGVPLIGVVHDVVGGVRTQAVRDGGMRSSDASQAPAGGLRVYGDRSFEGRPEYRAIAAQLQATDIRVGQAAVTNALSALRNGPAVYFKLPRTGRGGGSLWDYAATACCYAEAGGVATTFAGDSLPLNRSDTTFLGDCGVMFATDPALADRVRAAAG